MGKRAIGRILLWDALITAAIALSAGLLLGISLSKLFELLLIRLGAAQTDFTFRVSIQSIFETLKWFAGIFLLIFVSNLWQLRRTDPIHLLRSENAGEKPPKGNWFLGLLGTVLLITAYSIAVTIQDPIAALGWFCVAVVLVILATYLLFTSGSVLMCRMLQKNKRYYYKPNHFVSVSSMAFRMKRNGAGLASICILVTMVLVTVSTTTSLYAGTDDALDARCPEDFIIEFFNDEEKPGLSPELKQAITEAVNRTAGELGLTIQNGKQYTRAYGTFQNGEISFEQNYNLRLAAFLFLSIEDYNRLSGAAVTLGQRELLIYAPGFAGGTVTVGGRDVWTVAEHLEKSPVSPDDRISQPVICLIVPDMEAALAQFFGEDRAGSQSWTYCFDFKGSQEAQVEFQPRICAVLNEMQRPGEEDESSLFHFFTTGKASIREDFNATYGALFFLGLFLSAVFLFAAVLIIYYKQVSEGYEDQARFDIMQKVGMTRREIRRTINSQMLTVLFLPLATAGLHLCFAFPIVEKMLRMFDLTNVGLFIRTTAVSFAVFGMIYVLVYRMTSNAYYAIVSSQQKEQ